MYRLFLFFAVLVTLVGCQSPTGSNTQTPASNADPIVGTWTLSSYKNSSGTVTLDLNNLKTTDTVGTLTAYANGTYSSSATTNGNTTKNSGTWTVSTSGYTVTATNLTEKNLTATVVGKTLTFNYPSSGNYDQYTK
jgi:hypothetical protein